MKKKTAKGPDWSREERALLDRLDTAEKVQEYLDSIPYNDEITCRSPRRVMRDGKAHCMEGSLLAACAFAHHGRPAVLVDLRAAKGRDDDHVLTVYQQGRLYGAVAKSNFTGLRYRSPVYRSMRELAMSYFEDYYNTVAERTLRAYSNPLVLSDRQFPGWRTATHELDEIGEKLDALRHWTILSEAAARKLPLVDKRRYDAGMLGANPAGLFQA